MTVKALTRNPKRRDALRRLMLEHFNGEYGAHSLGLARDPKFKDYTPVEIRLMLYSLDVTGMVINANGIGTSGAIYQTTRLGQEHLKLMDEQDKRRARKQMA